MALNKLVKSYVVGLDAQGCHTFKHAERSWESPTMLPPRRVVGAPRVANKPTAASSDKPSSLASDGDVVIFYYFLWLPWTMMPMITRMIVSDRDDASMLQTFWTRHWSVHPSAHANMKHTWHRYATYIQDTCNNKTDHEAPSKSTTTAQCETERISLLEGPHRLFCFAVLRHLEPFSTHFCWIFLWWSLLILTVAHVVQNVSANSSRRTERTLDVTKTQNAAWADPQCAPEYQRRALHVWRSWIALV